MKLTASDTKLTAKEVDQRLKKAEELILKGQLDQCCELLIPVLKYYKDNPEAAKAEERLNLVSLSGMVETPRLLGEE